MRELVVLIGMMGAGKTTVARLVADRLGWTLVDTDDVVAARTGATPAELFASRGEAAFRAEEEAALADALAGDLSGGAEAVVATGGGVVLSEANRSALSDASAEPAGRAAVVWLRADPAVLASRVGGGEGRPLLGDRPTDALAAIDRERREHYAAVATAIVDVDGLAPGEVAERVLAAAGLVEGAA
jgi:shikimate kinase